MCNNEYKQNNYKGNILVVIDDLVSSLCEKSRDKFLSTLVFNRRHMLSNAVISIIITTQKFTTCPARLRSVANGVFMFDICKSELTSVRNELFFISKSQLEEIYHQAFDKPREHNFIYVRLSPYQIHINF